MTEDKIKWTAQEIWNEKDETWRIGCNKEFLDADMVKKGINKLLDKWYEHTDFDIPRLDLEKLRRKLGLDKEGDE